MLKKITYLILFITLMGNICLAQNKIQLDSLLLELSNQKSDTSKINILLQVTALYQKEDYSLAAEYSRQACDLAIKTGSKEYEAKAFRALAFTMYAMGNYKKATEHYFRALQFYEVVQDTMGIIAMTNNLGAVYDRLQDYDKALEYFFKAQEWLNKLNSEKQISQRQPSLFNNIANIYQTKADIPSAIEYYEKALAIAHKTNNKQLVGIVSNNLGKLYLSDLKEYEKSIKYLQQGLKVRIELGNKAEMSKSYNIIGDYYLKIGNITKAKEAVTEAIQLAQEIGSLEEQKAGYQNLAEIEKTMGNYRASLEAFTLFKQFNDSIQSQLASSEVARLQLQYDFEKNEQTRLHEQKQQRDRYIIIIIVLGACLLLAILVVFLIRSKSRQTELKRKNLSQDVEIKNKELTTNVMYLVRKNELINDVAERLLKIQPNVLPENNKVVHSIILDLQKEVDNDSWKEFELRFNQVHTEFYKNLRKLYPDLSPAEEKLCAFLRLNMSSKEVAAITQQSTKSVEVARARLRKKLHLTGTTSNLVTHLSNL